MRANAIVLVAAYARDTWARGLFCYKKYAGNWCQFAGLARAQFLLQTSGKGGPVLQHHAQEAVRQILKPRFA